MRKYTQQKARSLGITGFIRNVRPTGTVEGVLQGEKDSIDAMSLWLEKEGSPQSRPEKVVLEEVEDGAYDDFEIYPTRTDE